MQFHEHEVLGSLKNLFFLCNESIKSTTNSLKRRPEMKYQLAIIVFAFSFLSITALALNITTITSNVNGKGVIIEGYDVVSYFQNTKPLKGNDKIQVNQNGVIYQFANEENKQLFLKEPKKYEPQFGGWCAYAVAVKKEKVEVDPESYLIQDGRLLLFYDSLFAHTKKTWEDPKANGKDTFLKNADKNWPEVMNKKP